MSANSTQFGIFLQKSQNKFGNTKIKPYICIVKQIKIEEMENTIKNTSDTMSINTNTEKTMENPIEKLDAAIEGVFEAIAEIERKKMVFVITRTEHYKGERPKGVHIVETLSFEGLKEYGFDTGRTYQRARFPHNHGRAYKSVEEMSCGTILKAQAGEYIQRIK